MSRLINATKVRHNFGAEIDKLISGMEYKSLLPVEDLCVGFTAISYLYAIITGIIFKI
jgi:hypothetical protein